MHGNGSGRSLALAIACLLGLALTLTLSACGGDSPEATANARPEATTVTTETERAEPRAAATPSPCAAQLHDLLAAMNGLRTDLVGGLAYEQYVGEVKKIAAVYDELPVDQLALGCLRAAGTPGEQALNRYIAAGNEWSDCVEVPSCEAASIEAPLQVKWKQASEYLSKAQRGLRHQSSD